MLNILCVTTYSFFLIKSIKNIKNQIDLFFCMGFRLFWIICSFGCFVFFYNLITIIMEAKWAKEDFLEQISYRQSLLSTTTTTTTTTATAAIPTTSLSLILLCQKNQLQQQQQQQQQQTQ